MNEFRFAEPGWIHLLWLVAAAAGLLVLLEFRGRSVLEQFVSRIMQPRLVRRSALWQRLASLSLLSLAMAALVVALMRPQWGIRVERSVRVASQIMICLDVSRSMLAEDVTPNRLERAKIELDSLLGLMEEGQQVGLIAFAGKAAVLCPLTTDFGFLRLILNEAEPQSVGLGGTHIGEAIRKAVDGFREAGDIQRLILLVTDGEDHDSYPMEAAKAAKEKGIRIVSIGLGDEAGSKIEITDLRTGARSFLKDRNGNDVVSRLDGDTLREIALQTDGAYIPAGTGAMDLESIYRAHIATMLRGATNSEQQVVRNESYQWPVLASLVLVFAGLLVAAPVRRWQRTERIPSGVVSSAAGRAAVWGLAVSLLWQSGALWAQSPTSSSEPDEPARAGPASTATGEKTPDALFQGDAGAAEQSPAPEEENLTPRAAYNRAVAYVSTDPDRAERYLNQARRDAGSDGELRYRALYNLGWVEVSRADALLKDTPQQALQHLQQAVNRFREAVRVRPDSTEARHNLEIVSQRLLELADSLAKKDPADLASRLDEIIGQLRSHQAELQAAVERAGEEVQKVLAETYRPEFRRLGTAQRQIIADYQRLADDARLQLDALQKKPADQRSPEEQLRAGQYAGMLQFVDSALQRLNQSRGLTRQLQGNRAFRRWSLGLSETKRARDQLRNPVEVIGILLTDAGELAELTLGLSASTTALSAELSTPAAPVWLTREYLQELQTSIADRTQELGQMLGSAQLTSGAPAGGAPTEEPAASDPRSRQLLDNIRQALPFIERAADLFEQSAKELTDGSLMTAHVRQREAITALSEAWELFLDIRRLIEVLYRETSVLQQAAQQARGDGELLRQVAAAMGEALQKNIERGGRLDQLFDFELSQLAAAAASAPPESMPPSSTPPSATPPSSAPPSSAPPSSVAEDDPERQRLELAKQLLAAVLEHMRSGDRQLEILATQAKESDSSGPQSAPPEGGPTMPSTEPRGTESGTTVETQAAADDAREMTPPGTAPGESDGLGESHVSAAGSTAESAAADETAIRDPRWEPIAGEMDAAVKTLEELRRLFFSLVEHLRDTAQRQADLNDETAQQSMASPAGQTPEKIGPLANRQSTLQRTAQPLAEALREQGEPAAESSPESAAGAPSSHPAGSAEAAEASGKLLQAAELVDKAQHAMSAATRQLAGQAEKYEPDSKPFEKIRGQQQEALEKLLEALALLDESPPQQQQSSDQQQDDQQSSQDQQQQDRAEQQPDMSAQQLLQLIRDREAQRRDDKKKRATSAATGADRDW